MIFEQCLDSIQVSRQGGIGKVAMRTHHYRGLLGIVPPDRGYTDEALFLPGDRNYSWFAPLHALLPSCRTRSATDVIAMLKAMNVGIA